MPYYVFNYESYELIDTDRIIAFLTLRAAALVKDIIGDALDPEDGLLGISIASLVPGEASLVPCTPTPHIISQCS